MSLPLARGPLVGDDRVLAVGDHRVLLVEDDPIGRAFLREAIAPVVSRLDVAADCAQALALLRQAPSAGYALALLDLQLPDGAGEVLLQRLRSAGCIRTAVALTADHGVRMDAHLQQCGFAAVAHKPLAVAAVRAVLARWMDLQATHAAAEGVGEGVDADGGADGVADCPDAGGGADGVSDGPDAGGCADGVADGPDAGGCADGVADGRDADGGADGVAAGLDADRCTDGVADGRNADGGADGDAPLWDEQGALLAAGGHAGIVDALRNLLRSDLPGQRASVRGHITAGEDDQARAVLHRMQAACGFCGAAALEHAVRALDAALCAGTDTAGACAEFELRCRELEATRVPQGG